MFFWGRKVTADCSPAAPWAWSPGPQGCQRLWGCLCGRPGHAVVRGTRRAASCTLCPTAARTELSPRWRPQPGECKLKATGHKQATCGAERPRARAPSSGCRTPETRVHLTRLEGRCDKVWPGAVGTGQARGCGGYRPQDLSEELNASSHPSRPHSPKGRELATSCPLRSSAPPDEERFLKLFFPDYQKLDLFIVEN